MNQTTFETILISTFDALQAAYIENCEPLNANERSKFGKSDGKLSEHRLVFPRYSNEEEILTDLRLSEQELRFEFIHQLLIDEDNKWFYSIETPTIKRYSGFSKNSNNSKNSKPICNSYLPNTDPKHNGGRSGAIDTVIFNEEGRRVALIEFKANNPDEGDYWKDFVKLNNEPVGDNSECKFYFVQLLDVANAARFTSIIDKITGKNIDHKITDQSISLDQKKQMKVNYKDNRCEYYSLVLKKQSDSYKDAGIYYYDGSGLVKRYPKIEK